MRKVSMTARDELVNALARRYAIGSRQEKTHILDEFVAVTGFHRKHAMRLLRSGPSVRDSAPRHSRRTYNDAVREALVVLWEASDRICGKRLKALIPTLIEAMERHGHLQLGAEVRAGLVAMSAATIDRSLRAVREQAGGRKRRRAASPSSVRRSIPVRTFSDWDDPPPGFVEADLVAHSGPVARGSFVQTLVVTDIATGWTECAPLLYREQTLLREVLGEIRKLLPFELRGFDTDNDSVFVNETVRDYCRDAGILFTRCRPYRKNDQAFVEQKNGAVVRRLVGYRRLEGLAAAAALSRLYVNARLFVNFFQPSFKLAEKRRDGARVSKRYHPPATPCQRLLADPRTPKAVQNKVADLSATLDPIRLLRQIRAQQQLIVDIADQPVAEPDTAILPPLEQFLAGLRTAWSEGEARPTAKPAEKPKRGRRRPDPLARVTEQLHAWFESEPWRSSRELLDKLQAAHPGEYPDNLLRTVQRRVKVWRKEKALSMVFGDLPEEESLVGEAGGHE
ncbi:MAG: transposase family protein [Gammaproteobacteria bacterium]|nr:transposase family protein [Gammaproteobacteria bacterium]